jgi:hypothetical protein
MLGLAHNRWMLPLVEQLFGVVALLVCHLERDGWGLNQSAFSLYFFMRDIADPDIVGRLESVIIAARCNTDDFGPIQTAVLSPLQHLFGLSSKMLTIVLSELLIGDSRIRQTWLDVGASAQSSYFIGACVLDIPPPLAAVSR